MEQTVESIPDTLNIRFARVDKDLAEIKEVQAIHSTRLSKIDRRLESLEQKVDALPRVIAELLDERLPKT